MSFPAYPEYKDSGVPWLGNVPTHWSTAKIKHTYRFSTGWTPPSGRDDYYGNDHLWANISDLGERYIGDTAKGISDLAVRELDMAVSPAGSLLFSFKLSLGLMSFTTTPMFTNEAIASFQPDHSHSLQFAYYAFPIYIVANATENIYGAKMLNQERIRSAPICLPSLDEQQAIAAFLDRETAKIDALVAEQERLIALLKEKRQAVISHAVTKGLDPNAPMKDSGIEWLGEIPAHWETGRLGQLTSKIGSGKTPSGGAEIYVEEGVLFLRSQNIYDEGLDWREVVRIPNAIDEEMRSTRVAKGDILLNITGASLGRTCLFVGVDEPANVNQHVCIIRLASLDRLQFVAMAMKSTQTKAQIDAAQNGAAREGLNFAQIARLAIALPPAEEADAIVREVGEQSEALGRLAKDAETAIELLRERRAALISSAVTGKIDVRGLVMADNVFSIETARAPEHHFTVHGAVGAQSIAKLGKLGRMAVMKGGFLAEAHAGITEIGGRYERAAAGPYSRAVVQAMEHDAITQFGITVKESDQRVEYTVPQDANTSRDVLRELVGQDRADRFLNLLDLLKSLGRGPVEAVATLYAAWNDLLAQSGETSDEAVIDEVLTEWDAEKAEKFTKRDLETWLEWMRRHDIVPDGSDPITDHQVRLP